MFPQLMGGGARIPFAPPAPRPVGPVAPRAPIGDPIGVSGPMPVQGIPRAPVGQPAPFRPIGQFHKGGRVPKTGSYLLKAGEHVVAKGKKMTNRKPQNLASVKELMA
jgi:hypothetical protein